MWWSVAEDSGQCSVLRWSRRRHTSYVKKLFWSFVFWLRLSSNAWGYDCLRVWPQLFLLFFVCLWPGDFLSLFFLLKIFLFPTLLVSCSFREQLGAAQPSCFATAAHTSYLFSKNKGKLEYHITPYKTTPFLNNYSHKQGLLFRALATFGGWAKCVQSEAVCLKQSLAVASILPFHWSLKAVRLPTTDYTESIRSSSGWSIPPFP